MPRVNFGAIEDILEAPQFYKLLRVDVDLDRLKRNRARYDAQIAFRRENGLERGFHGEKGRADRDRFQDLAGGAAVEAVAQLFDVRPDYVLDVRGDDGTDIKLSDSLGIDVKANCGTNTYHGAWHIGLPVKAPRFLDDCRDRGATGRIAYVGAKPVKPWRQISPVYLYGWIWRDDGLAIARPHVHGERGKRIARCIDWSALRSPFSLVDELLEALERRS